MEITRILAGTLPAERIDATVAEVVAFDRIINADSGMGEDFDPLPAEVRKRLTQPTDYTTNEFWLGRLGGRIVAKGIAYLDLKDNLNGAEIHVSVHPEHRRRGLGGELLAVIEEDLRADGRTRLTSFNEVPATVVAADLRGARIAAASGTGALPADLADVAFARAHGYSLRQIERCAIARLRPPEHDVAEPDDGYEILTWSGPVPEKHLDALAVVHRAMSTDTPGSADLEEEEFWDAERVRALDRQRADAGERMHTALAVRRPSRHDGGPTDHGESPEFEVAGYTEAAHFDDRPAVAFQGGTLVLRDHRGHGLGARLKRANHGQLLRSSPVERVYTWNAVENAWMLAINVRAGFETFAWTGVWKKELPTTASAGERNHAKSMLA